MNQITDEQVLQFALHSFPEPFEAKFREGMAKYTSPITDKDCLKEARQECLDFWSYIHAEMMKRERALGLATLLIMRHKLQHDSDANQLIALLSTQPLAVKKTD